MAGENKGRPSDYRVSFISAAINLGLVPEQLADTIGCVWSAGLLKSNRTPTEHMRESARIYAQAYWSRYGTASARVSSWREVVSGGSDPNSIPDEEIDEFREINFRNMDESIPGRSREAVSRYCLDQHGDNTPLWLWSLLLDFPRETESLRASIETSKLLVQSKNPSVKNAGKVALARSLEELRASVLALKQLVVPHDEMRRLNEALEGISEQIPAKVLARRVGTL